MPGDAELSTPSTNPTLDELVERTRGLQPWRKLFHAVNGLSVAAAIVFLDIPSETARWILGPIALGLLVLDALRLLHPPSNALFFRAFRLLASPREARGLASSTWYALGIALAVLLFPLEHAVTGILVLGLADPSASYVGQRWGRRPFLGGSVAGTVVFLAVAAAVLLSRHPWGVAAVSVLAVTLAERKSWPLDDNFAIPLVSAAATTGSSALLG